MAKIEPWKQWLVVVILFAVAGVLFGMQIFSRERPVVKPRSPEEQIAEIQNNPHMPEQAKAIAIGQIRAHSRQGTPSPTNR